ncbi:hypothetical protein LZ24_02531 [Desulfobotulus alkaliphilus]|uniref:Uncharacterized protein n=1 Tax=Desulfobotulus alkaliphilus TaxID=622671 RepID=A0A562RHP8_9BACT|nr:hypothetical protein [Desulfobotulus alkaliphilus]TWI68558.1 hypothetical protein LZ24_02531 [Desulfobotulus alkaliphilus]
MKNRIQYTDEPMGKVRPVADFLPTPEELALKEETVKEKGSTPFYSKNQ